MNVRSIEERAQPDSLGWLCSEPTNLPERDSYELAVIGLLYKQPIDNTK